MESHSQQYFMKQAIAEGEKALPNCNPNPPVGCVIVKEGKIVARGYTNEPGKDHAELMALKQLKEEDHSDKILYVTLEPCSFQGKTPSCAKAIIEYGIKSVVVGIEDPHPMNQGAGIDLLKNAGVQVQINCMADIIIEKLRPYLVVG